MQTLEFKPNVPTSGTTTMPYQYNDMYKYIHCKSCCPLVMDQNSKGSCSTAWYYNHTAVKLNPSDGRSKHKRLAASRSRTNSSCKNHGQILNKSSDFSQQVCCTSDWQSIHKVIRISQWTAAPKREADQGEWILQNGSFAFRKLCVSFLM